MEDSRINDLQNIRTHCLKCLSFLLLLRKENWIKSSVGKSRHDSPRFGGRWGRSYEKAIKKGGNGSPGKRNRELQLTEVMKDMKERKQ